jgi:sortase A
MADPTITTGTSAADVAVGKRGRRRSSRALRAIAIALIAVGALALADAIVTLVWQEPFSALYAELRQDHLNGALARTERTPPTPAESRTLATLADQRARIAFLAGELYRRTPDGGAVGRIVIPRIGASFVVVKGTSTEDLEGGPGVYPETGLPGTTHTTAIAGHRTTFLAPFRHIDALSPGSSIRLRMPYGEFTYAVIGQRVVEPTDVQAAIANVGYNRLVLSACTPVFSAAKRLLVFAHLIRTVPRGAARRLPGGAVPRTIEAPARRRRPHGRGHGHGHGGLGLPPVLESLDPHMLSALI